MIGYPIKLTKAEVVELKGIINKGSHTSQTFRVAYIFLNSREGKYSEKVTNEQSANRTEVCGSISHVAGRNV